jgi:hypothetical protein
MPADQPTIIQKLVLAREEVSQPMFARPAYWPWGNLDRGEAFALIAPSEIATEAIKAATNWPRSKITYERSFRVRDDGREAVLFTCVEKIDRGVKVKEVIDGSASPTGQKINIVMRMRFTKQDVLAKKRHSWPWKNLNPGEGVIVSGPRSFMDQVSITAASYIHPACDRKIRSKRDTVRPDDTRDVLVWCEKL